MTAAPGPISLGGSPAKTYKSSIHMSVRALDNGYLLEVSKDLPDGYERVELSFATLPKLLKAIGTFFKEYEAVQ